MAHERERDPLDDGQQPRCPNCGTVMVDEPGVIVCRGCGAEIAVPQVGLPQEFQGPTLHDGDRWE